MYIEESSPGTSILTERTAHRQDRFGADWRWWSALWWTTLIVAAVSPSALASLVCCKTKHWPSIPNNSWAICDGLAADSYLSCVFSHVLYPALPFRSFSLGRAVASGMYGEQIGACGSMHCALQAKLQNGLRHIDGAANTALEFSIHHPITIPKKVTVIRNACQFLPCSRHTQRKCNAQPGLLRSHDHLAAQPHLAILQHDLEMEGGVLQFP